MAASACAVWDSKRTWWCPTRAIATTNSHAAAMVSVVAGEKMARPCSAAAALVLELADVAAASSTNAHSHHKCGERRSCCACTTCQASNKAHKGDMGGASPDFQPTHSIVCIVQINLKKKNNEGTDMAAVLARPAGQADRGR
eukprot:1160883-Pelagomonas_calceolata.AAC.4